MRIRMNKRQMGMILAGAIAASMLIGTTAAYAMPGFGDAMETASEAARAAAEYAGDAARMVAQTGCDGVMIARAARGNPWLFAGIRQFLDTGTEPQALGQEELCGMILRHGRLLAEEKGENTAMREMRKHVAWYTAGMPHSSRLRARCNALATLQDLEALLADFYERRQ